ncbi:MAG: peptidylprolyl isomerase [Planctomycetaceae bacterium]|nr:peptidylprolyl isomerase [Planctomycetaceae bacterium]
MLAALVCLLNVSSAVAADPKAPEKFQVKFETTKGDIVIECIREWSPIGVDHFHKAVTEGFFNDCRFFRVVPGFIVQFGINGDPKVQRKWKKNVIKDDPVTQTNAKGTLTYATSGPNTRTTQLFINFGDNAFLDRQGFSPFAKITQGMDVVAALNAEYGESPNQTYIQDLGNRYLKDSFPNLDYIKKATVLKNK